MKNLLLIVLFALSSILNIILFTRISESNNRIAENEIVLNKYLDYVFGSQFGNIDASNETLNHEIFKNIKSESIMIYRFYGERCNKCVVAELCMLKEFEKNKGFKVFVLHPEPKSRQEDILNVNTLGNLSYKYVGQDEFNIDNKNFQNRSFYAILKKDGTMNNVFFPDSKLPDLTNAYFNKAISLQDKNLQHSYY